jgi:HTH-type transcriptional regulator, cell division transcriptional repressor
MSFGKTLAGLREKAELTQAQLALRAGLSLDTLRGWEQDRSLPKVDDAYRLAKALGVGLEKLIRPDDMEPEPEQPKKTRKRKQ